MESNNDFPPHLSKPALRALDNAGIVNLNQLSAISETELKKLHGMGPKAIEQLRVALEARGLTFSK